MKRKLRKLLSLAFNLIPKTLRHHVIRELVAVPTKPPEGMVFKFAETDEEFNQAFALLQECYAEIGIAEKSLKLRATKFHTLPTSTVIIAKVNNEVVGTLTHVLDNPMGLPIEEHWDIDLLRQKGELLAELSSLAIKKKWRHHNGLFMFLTRFALDFAMKHLNIDAWVMVTHPNVRDFYEALLCFKPLSEEIYNCDYVKGAAGFAQRLDLNQLKSNFTKLYENKKPDQNIHDFYFKSDFSKCFGTIKKDIVLSNFMNSDYFVHLFFEVTQVIPNLEKSDMNVIDGMYSQVVPILQNKSRPHRSPTSFVATLLGKSNIYLIKVLNVSPGGAKILCKQDIDPKMDWTLKIKTEDQKCMELPVEVVWTQHSKIQGLRIIGEPPAEWVQWTQQLVQNFNSNMMRKAV